MQHIAISGELGSGKSTLASIVSARLGMTIVRSGDALRDIAMKMGVSALTANLLAEEQPTIDAKIDDALKAMAASSTPTIFDSRMAWHFVPEAFKIHLIVNPLVAAQRLSTQRRTEIENYESPEHARQVAEARHQSEARRFKERYDVDIARLRNYDLVVDTSDAAPENIAQSVIAAFQKNGSGEYLLRPSPRRVIPAVTHRESEHIGFNNPPIYTHNKYWQEDQSHPIIGYSRPCMFAVDGFNALSKALQAGRTLVAASLVAEAYELVDPRTSAIDVLQKICPLCVRSWEAMHEILLRN